MRHYTLILLLSSLFLLVIAVGHSQELGFHWERTDRTSDGWMSGTGSSFNVGLTPDGTTLMTTPEGLFRIEERNEDGILGYVAELINPEIDGYFVGTIGDRVYLKREGGNEVWASSDNGISWEQIIAYAPYNAVEIIGDGSIDGSKIVTYDPNADNLIFSSPTGQPLSTRKLPIRQWGLAASPAGVLYIWEINPGMNDQILRSHDLGNTWISVALDGLDDAHLYSFLYVGDSILIALTNKGLAVSNDEGESWTLRDETAGINMQVPRADLIYAVRGATSTENPNSFTLTRSVDAGQSWSECVDAPTLSIRALPDGSLYAITEGVMWRTDGCGSPWKRVHGDFRSVSVDTVLAIDNDFLAVVYGVLPGENRIEGGGYLMRSRDDGATWEPIVEGATSILGLTDGGTLYLSIEQTTPVQDTGEGVIEWSREVRQSFDRGETWRSLPDLGASSRAARPVGALQLQGEKYVIMTRKGPGLSSSVYPLSDLLYSSDGGTTFELIDSIRLKGKGATSYMRAYLLPDGRIYGGPAMYSNESTAFSRFDPRTGVREELPSPVPFAELWLGPSGRLYGWKSERLFRSEDGGESWDELVNPMPEQTIRGISEGAGDMLYLGLWNREIYQSTDDGTTWKLTRDIDWNVDFGPALQIPLVDIEPVDTLHGLHIANVLYGAFDTLSDGYVRRVGGRTLVYSTDGGSRSWYSAIDHVLHYRDITGFAINDRGVIVAGTWSGGLYRTVGPSGVDGHHGRLPIIIDLW